MKSEAVYRAKDAPTGIVLYFCDKDRIVKDETVRYPKEDFYRIVCVSEGNGAFYKEGKEFLSEYGDFMITYPGEETCCFKAKSRGAEVLFLAFGGRDAATYLKDCGIDRQRSFGHADVPGFILAADKCRDILLEEKDRASATKLGVLLLVAIASLKETSDAKHRKHRSSDRCDIALGFIENNYSKGITSSDVAAYLGIDRSHFFRIFKSKIGISPERYIINYRVARASEMLAATDLSVAKIAARVGVTDICYFSKLFKKATGKSPSDFRKDSRSKKE